ncbi:MAG: Endonuclease MutS2 [candidate division WS6 bacterium OLB20]|uniref:Endonuclease MutS2 n=1 Tax=candidate division WS6 bacterium OLB20 TaxID=1617426 RepID=A0A136LXU1_9BACT|nr:MAG: Endonuclease MutS2 [candidate division WS6 bacterium OLB20]
MMFVPDSVLDFHGRDVRNAFDIEQHLAVFLEDCYARGDEMVLVITGKGNRSPKGPVIRPLVAELLKRHKLVASFKQAGYGYGGEGAFEVYFVSDGVL